MENTKTVFHQRGTWLHPATGEAIALPQLIDTLAQKSAVLIGETHDIAEIHRWQQTVCAFLYTRRQDMMVGFEMFPRRLQPVLDDWVHGKLTTDDFIEKAEWYKVWGFPAEIYLPIFHFCRQNRIRMLALNCYRELVTRVGKEGWDAIPESERDGLTPSAPPLAGYVEHLHNMTGRMPGAPVQNQKTQSTTAKRTEFDTARFMRAMQTWDRAFACNIVHARNEAIKHTGKAPLIVGIIGRGHLEYGFGMPYQLLDLGVKDSAVLLPSFEEHWTLMPDIPAKDGIPQRPFAEAVFRLDMPEPRATRRNMPKNTLSERKQNTETQS